MTAYRTAEAQGASPVRERHSQQQPSPGTAPVIAARVAAALFGVVAAFHAALVLGAPWGELTQGGSTIGALSTSGRLVAALSCALSILMACSILARVGRGPLHRTGSGLRAVLAWATVLYSVMAVVLNLITRSSAERGLWAPVAVVLLGLVTFVMVTTSSRLSRRL